MATRKQVTMMTLWALAGALLVMPAHASDKYPEFSDELAAGRSVWLNNCETCHAYGIAGAPNPLQPLEWADRVKTPLSTLYEHAIQGFFSPSDTHMPPRGGNPELKDSEVESAVDYMLALARFYLSTNER